jgi:hypothetical protein
MNTMTPIYKGSHMENFKKVIRHIKFISIVVLDALRSYFFIDANPDKSFISWFMTAKSFSVLLYKNSPAMLKHIF